MCKVIGDHFEITHLISHVAKMAHILQFNYFDYLLKSTVSWQSTLKMYEY